jgi:hypothetical protein
MPENKGNYGSPGRKFTTVKIVNNQPSPSLNTALSNAKKQVDASK